MVFTLLEVLNSKTMGYQGNKGNLPGKEEQVKNKTTDQSSNAEGVRRNNIEQSLQVADDNSTADGTGTRDTDTDTLGNP